jgi:hypothetical protein
MADLPSGKWDFYWTQWQGHPASVFLDLAAARHKDAREHLLIAMVHLHTPHPTHRLTTDEEAEVLFKLEECLLREAQGAGLQYVGRGTSNGRRIFHFYASAQSPVTFPETASAFPTYPLILHWKHDPRWSFYRTVLYPSPAAMQTIGNRGVLEQLKKSGDSLHKPREVSHWSYFPTAAARDAFLDQVQNDGYRLVKADAIDAPAQKAMPHRAIYAKVQPLDPPREIDDVTVALYELTARYGGTYDGWETSVEKD